MRWMSFKKWAILLSFISLSPPAVAGSLDPPSGVRKLFELRATGVQIYVCELRREQQNEASFGWAFSRPEAVLLDASGKRAGQHGKGPSWGERAGRHDIRPSWALNDGSQIEGEVTAQKASPQPDAIPWLLLKVISHSGTGKLEPVTFVRRVDTIGGVAPQGGCDSAHAEEEKRVPYNANYEFFGP